MSKEKKETVLAYKGFDKNLQCRNFQYEIGKTYDYSAASNTGDYSAASNTGYRSAASVAGKNSVAMATGRESKAMASEGSAIVLCNYDDDGNLRHIKSAIAGEGEIKPDTWYTLDSEGNFKETI